MPKDRSITRRLAVAVTAATIGLTLGAPAPARAAPAESDRLAHAKDLIAGEQWSRAIPELRAAVSDGREPARDEALFWLAHSLHETGASDEALSAIDRLEREYPKSRWVKPARSLRIEIAQQQGRTDLLLAPIVPPTPRTPRIGRTPKAPHVPRTPRGAAAPHVAPAPLDPPAAPEPPLPPDLDIKLQALQAVIEMRLRQGLDTGATVTVLTDLAKESDDPALRRRALFVLAQTHDPKARAVILDLAQSGSPDVRIFAVQQLGLFGGADARKPLLDIYDRSGRDVRRQVLRMLRFRGDPGALVDVARRESDRALRDIAIQQLGILGSRRELMTLYDSGLPATGSIVQALFAMGARDELTRIAHDARNPRDRADASSRLEMLARHAPDPAPNETWEQIERELDNAGEELERRKVKP